MITKINEAKLLVKDISFYCRCKFNSTIRNLNKKWNNDKCQCKCKRYRTCRKGYNWNHKKCIFENSRHVKSIVMIHKLCVMKLKMSQIVYQQM